MSSESTSKKDFTILAEWTIRKLRKIDFTSADKEIIIRWILYSLGIEKLGQDIYIYIRERGSATSTEIAEKFGISPATARKYLEQLHLVGLVDYIGREYHLSFEDISRGIKSILIPRINDVFQALLRAAAILRKYEISEEKVTLPEVTSGDWVRFTKRFQEFEKRFREFEEKTRKLMWTGVKIKETDEFIIMDIFRSHELTSDDLIRCAEKGKKLIMHVFGSLKISNDVDPSIASSVIYKIVVYGSVHGPKNVLNQILDRLEIYGSLKVW